KRRTRVLIQRKCDLIQTRFVLVVDACGVERKENRTARLEHVGSSRRRRYFMNGDRRRTVTAGAGLIAPPLVGGDHRANSDGPSDTRCVQGHFSAGRGRKSSGAGGPRASRSAAADNRGAECNAIAFGNRR